MGDDVLPLARRMKNVQLESKCAIKLLTRIASETSTIIYADPPYRTANTTPYGKERVAEIDWNALTKAFQAQKGRVAISGYGDEWNHLNWRRHATTTRANPLKKNRARVEEVLWTNY